MSSSTWSARIPVVRYEDAEGYEPTVRADVSFGQFTMPMHRAIPDGPLTPGRAVPKPFLVATNPPPVEEELPAPMIAPPPSATRAIAIGFTIGTTLGLALLGGVWHFIL